MAPRSTSRLTPATRPSGSRAQRAGRPTPVNALRPRYRALSPSSPSIRSSRLYLATRSDRDGAPVLIWPVPIATTRSAIVVSSVSPERCETTADQPARAGQRDRLDRLGQRPDLVELDEDRVRAAFLDAATDPIRVGHEQVVADELDRAAEPLGQPPPAGPVVLGQAVLERDDRVARGPVGPQVDQLVRSRASGPRAPGRSASARRRSPIPARRARSSPGRARSRRRSPGR